MLFFFRVGEKHENFHQSQNDHFVRKTECLTRWRVQKIHINLSLMTFYRHPGKCFNFRKFEYCKMFLWKWAGYHVCWNYCCLKVRTLFTRLQKIVKFLAISGWIYELSSWATTTKRYRITINWNLKKEIRKLDSREWCNHKIDSKQTARWYRLFTVLASTWSIHTKWARRNDIPLALERRQHVTSTS